jgi:hypothetical protein
VTTAHRYELVEPLGQGGTAIVHRARDLATGKDVALKQLRFSEDCTPNNRKRATELFEREFHVLSQLTHPNVIAVYDYGIDDDGPYYTMELLDGGDLAKRAPMDWRIACAVGRDVSSALSLIHSRRMVYRDLSPRNVRCRDDGTAKLIDFGAMTAMGPTKFFVGTLATAAPESVTLQPLDARADLYSLGTTLYFALTGRRPFPARSAAQLVESWRTRPAPPSQLVPGIPEALDALVMDLLQIEPTHRPASAGEVMARLSAVAGLPEREEEVVSRAYLTTPTLVGRDATLDLVNHVVNELLAGRGSALAIDGAGGTGRSRFLDACVLSAKMAGITVLRADSSDSGDEDHGVTRALVRQLLDAAPDVAIAAAKSVGGILLHVAPELARELTHERGEEQKSVQSAVRDWLIAVSAHRPMAIAVDDVDRIDHQSAALLALLARASPSHSLVVATTTDSERAEEKPALTMLVAASRVLRLEGLSDDDVETMLSSVFGDVPHVQHVARRLQTVARGRPREVMQLAQHLVDRSIARYQDGLWSLPESLAADELPSDVLDAVRGRVEALPEHTREVVQAMALEPNARYSFEECIELAGGASHADVLARLTALVAADLVAAVGADYMLTGQAIGAPIVASLNDHDRRKLHLRLATLLERREGAGLALVSHLFGAGADERAIDVLVRHAEASVGETDASPDAYARLIQSLLPDWLELYDRGVGLCRAYARPRSHEFSIHVRVAGIASMSKVSALHHFGPLFDQLIRDAGLDIYASLGTLAPADRIRAALGGAMERFAKTPESQRCNDPATALRLLGRMVVAGIGSAGMTFSRDLWKLFPSLAPLISLSPALGVVQTMSDGLGARMVGANQSFHELYAGIIDRLGHDQAGLEETYRTSIRLGLNYVVAALEATMGLATSLTRAQDLETSPLHEVNAVLVRMLYHLWQGDFHRADACKEEAEVLNIERLRPQGVDGSHLLRELPAYAAVDDLTRVKQTLDRIEPMAKRLADWRPVLHWAKAEYERIRGALPAALLEVELALGLMPLEGYPIWGEAAGTHLKVLLALGRVADARKVGLLYLATANERRVGNVCNAIRLPLALALARQEDFAGAAALADEAIEYCTSIGSTGINPFLAHETRAQVAALLGDDESFWRHSELCRQQIRDGSSGTLHARHERLEREFNEKPVTAPMEPAPAAGTSKASAFADLVDIADPAARAARCLDILLEATGTRAGFLFAVVDNELRLVARHAAADLPSNVEALAVELALGSGANDDTTTDIDGSARTVNVSPPVQPNGDEYLPVLVCEGATVLGIAMVLGEGHRRFRHPTEAIARVAHILASGSQIDHTATRKNSEPPRFESRPP